MHLIKNNKNSHEYYLYSQGDILQCVFVFKQHLKLVCDQTNTAVCL